MQPGNFYFRRKFSSSQSSTAPPPPAAVRTQPSPQQQFPPPPGESFGSYGTLLFRGFLAVGMVYCFNEYVAEITLLEGPSMYPTLQPYGEIVLIDKFTLRRIHGEQKHRRKHGGSHRHVSICQGQERLEHALQLQAAYERQQKKKKNNENRKDEDTMVDEWHEPRISVSDIKATWASLWELLTTPLSIGDVVVLQHPNRKGTICKRVLGLPGDTVLRPSRRGGLLVIPDGHLWVEGDNPSNSSDSRTYGPVPMALLRGRVLFRVWPLVRLGVDGHHQSAILVRGAPPRQSNGSVGYTVLPAGYEGQRIVKFNNTTTATTSTNKQRK
ncbi:hypothetical protein ACA910_002641 [Epithemia clementina (nom. ined.)]